MMASFIPPNSGLAGKSTILPEPAEEVDGVGGEADRQRMMFRLPLLSRALIYQASITNSHLIQAPGME